MKKINLALCFFLLTLCSPILLFAQTTRSTVDVRILEIFHPQMIQITSAIDTTNIHLENGSLFVDGKRKPMFFSKHESQIRIGNRIERTYRGTVKVYPTLEQIIIINRVSINDYLSSVIGAEMGEAPFEAQKSQAIVSRTYLFTNLKRHKQYDFCDLTHCQVYKGKESETAATRAAAKETESTFLWNKNELAEVFYHSTCGGKTANFSSIFKGINESIVSVPDSNYCADSPHYRWEWKLPFEDASFKEIEVLKINEDGRATEIEVDGKKQDGWNFRMRTARQFGWNKLRSSWFTVEKKEDHFYFKGKGLGHGLGMCQWGAKKMAEKGKTAEEILKHYFPALEVR